MAGCAEKQSPPPVDPIATASAPEWQPVVEVDHHVPVIEPLTHTAQPNEPNVKAISTPLVEKIFRPSDSRPVYDEKRVADLGIHRFESQRLILYTDINPEIAKTLPPLVDQLYEAWVEYFGELPPNREGTNYQVTGYLIKEQDRFRAIGMLPEDLPFFEHGRHRGAEFWLNEQEFDYYRRHLLFHEATHCFMMTMPGRPPDVWYLEGMAEYFGTHTLAENGDIAFGVMPDASKNFTGFGRVQMIQNEVGEDRYLTLRQTTQISNADFQRSRTVPYLWSWAICKFLETHPRYHDRFHELGQHLIGSKFYELVEELVTAESPLIEAEWSQFIRTLHYGFEIEANAFVVAPAQPLQQGVTLEVVANRGWQASGIELLAGQTCQISATGQVTLADVPKPWISEPNGITIRYANQVPIGTLQVAVLSETGEFKVQHIGIGGTYTPTDSGIVYFRVNDFPNELQDNTGRYTVTVQPQ